MAIESVDIQTLQDALFLDRSKRVDAIGLSALPESSDHIQVTIRPFDANGNAYQGLFSARVWLADSSTNPALAVTPADAISTVVGTIQTVYMAGTDVGIICTQNYGSVQFDYAAGPKTWYVWVEIGGVFQVLTITFA